MKKQLALRKTDHGTLVKDSTLKLFKCVGEYVRLCANELKSQNQTERMLQFEQNTEKYIEKIQSHLEKEVKVHDESMKKVLDAFEVS